MHTPSIWFLSCIKMKIKRKLEESTKEEEEEEDIECCVPSKKPKMCELDSHLINNVLPKMCSAELEKVLLKHGPQKWKQATDLLSSNDAKKLILLIVKQTNLVEPFAVYVSMFETNDVKPATPLYELGLGYHVKQFQLHKNSKNKYLRVLIGNSQNLSGYLDVEPILPSLNNNLKYFCLNKNLVQDENLYIVSQREDPKSFTAKDLFFKKLISAVTCASLGRWSECFAHSLSALDIYQNKFVYLHDVYCYIALSASKMFVSLDWCCKVLSLALQCETSFEHAWRRLNVLQVVLNKQGLFDMESEVYLTAKSLFAKCSEFYPPFLIQHLNCLMMQVEDNLAFQYVRQNFHNKCAAFCEKDPCLKQSFAATQKLLKQIDMLAPKLRAPGQKEYFQAYYHLYSTMTNVNKYSSSKKDNIHLELAENFFCLSRVCLVRNGGSLYKDAEMMTQFIIRKKLNFVMIKEHFSRGTNMHFTNEEGTFLFRAMLITMYWQDRFQPIALELWTKNARETYAKTTNGKGYRTQLLAACCKILDDSFFHRQESKDEDNVEDFPVLNFPPQELVRAAKVYWNQEKIKLQLFEDKAAADSLAIPVTAEAILHDNTHAKDVYAFGFQICLFLFE